MAVQKRLLAGREVSAIGLGCMNLSHAYGTPPDAATGQEIIQTAFDLGVDHFDTAILYGFGANEKLVGEAIKPFRHEILLASKCGLTNDALEREVNGRPEAIKKACEASLKRLQTEVIDLYYLHRWDKSIPIEDSVGALKDLVAEGKVRAIGLSEVSADTLLKANAVHPIAAVQTEYSLWTRNAEIAVLNTCKEIGAAFVAFSPLGRGFLSGTLAQPANFVTKDLRNNMPRFQEPNYSANLQLLKPLRELSEAANISMSQLALAWLLQKGEHLHAIPGTTQLAHLQENTAATGLVLADEIIAMLDQCCARAEVQGGRYNDRTQLEIDTEEFTD